MAPPQQQYVLLLLMMLTTIFGIMPMVSSASLNQKEFDSIKWIAQQFSTGWNIATGTTCSDISSTDLVCGNNISTGEDTVTLINITLAVKDNGTPDPLKRSLYFPNLVQLNVNNITPKNESFVFLSMFDNIDNKLLSIISIDRCQFGILIPYLFPSVIPLTSITITTTVLSTSVPSSLFTYKGLKQVYLNNISFDFANQTVYFDPSLRYDTLTDVFIRSSESFYFVIDSSSLISWTSTFNRLNLSQSTVEIIRAPKLDVLSLNDGRFKPDNLTHLTSLRQLYLAYTNELKDVNNLGGLLMNGPEHTRFPPNKWMAKNRGVFIFSNTNLNGPIPDYSSNHMYHIFIGNSSGSSLGINGAVPDFTCSLEYLDLSGTSVTSVPPCFYCSWGISNVLLPASIPPPPANYKCPFVVDKKLYVIPRNKILPYSLTITGQNLGYLEQNDFSPAQLVKYYPNTMFTLPVSTPTGGSTLVFSQKRSISTTITWETDMTNVNSVIGEINGYNLYMRIEGTFFFQYPYIVQVYGNDCKLVQLSTALILCIVDTRLPKKTSYASVDSTYSPPIINNFNVYYLPSIKTATPLGIQGGQTTLTGYIGFNIKQSKVLINDSPCNVTNVIGNGEDSIVTCNITGPLKPGMANLTVIVNQMPFTSVLVLRIYNYNMTINTCIAPNNFTECSGNGVCVNGTCQCQDGYGGSYCDGHLTPSVIILPNATDPSVDLVTRSSQFQFNIVALQELDQERNIVKELLTDQWSYNESKVGQLNIFDYTLDINQTDAEWTGLAVAVQFSQSPQVRQVQFAGHNVSYSPNTIKMTLNITGWNFHSNVNMLRVVYRSDLKGPEVQCRRSKVESQVDQQLDNLQYLKIIHRDAVYYGRFLPYAYLDGRVAYSLNQLINSTHNNETTFVGTVLPICKKCWIDPDFTVITAVDDGVVTCSSGLSTWKISLIAVFSGVVGISLFVGVILFFKRKSHKIKEKKLMTKKLHYLQEI
ncbi:hypothetical protein SAMD00019534_041200 [Acytostelium subglobosum LB1]|uniref:hypothetical protein n=1 Tax=Acytostelium subglobosum LB1 TaxID=1410327 RepID=UPI0006449463|nr:hypothetical protein SAMD00019534_041200 [Acytostelium subglobosum LB1]GAM20945.1 hypothetical protein SAMD00019534_041200 [Acytostelium subglobosum LB1]|eukprot:XP_012756079.1 hypothetical protein SAMD00019534_041200 [Acytostelium subglobosum LB1]